MHTARIRLLLLTSLMSGAFGSPHAEPDVMTEELGLAVVTVQFETPERLRLDCTNRKPTRFGVNWLGNCENAARKALERMKETGKVSFEVPRYPFARTTASTMGGSLGPFMLRDEVWAIGAILDVRSGERVALLAAPR